MKLQECVTRLKAVVHDRNAEMLISFVGAKVRFSLFLDLSAVCWWMKYLLSDVWHHIELEIVVHWP